MIRWCGNCSLKITLHNFSDSNLKIDRALTSDKREEEVEQAYNKIQQALDVPKNRDSTIIMGEFNAKIGKGKVENVIGAFWMNTRMEMSHRITQWF